MNFGKVSSFMSRNFSELNVFECLHFPAHSVESEYDSFITFFSFPPLLSPETFYFIQLNNTTPFAP